MDNLSLDRNFINSINFFENILLLDSIENTKKIYNMFVDYLRQDNHYILKMNIKDKDREIINTKCVLANKVNGSIVISDIIKLVTSKYNSDLVINVKELDTNNNCIKFGKRVYNSKNK